MAVRWRGDGSDCLSLPQPPWRARRRLRRVVSQIIWVAELRISRQTWEKIQNQHRLSGYDVREAVEHKLHRAVWDDNPERGLRALIQVTVLNKRVLVVLYPRPADAYGDSYALGSAYTIG